MKEIRATVKNKYIRGYINKKIKPGSKCEAFKYWGMTRSLSYQEGERKVLLEICNVKGNVRNLDKTSEIEK